MYQKDKMKIAIHSPRVSYFYGGTERYIINMVLHLSEKFDVFLFTLDSPEESEWFKKFKKKFKMVCMN